MLKLMRGLAFAAVAALSVTAFGGQTHAATVTISDGDVINPINPSDVYIFEDILRGDGGPGSVSFTFIATPASAPLPVLASNATLVFLGSSILNPFMNWFDGVNTTSATFISAGSAMVADLSTIFTNPNALTQTLTFGWDAYDGPVQVSIAVGAVPLPAGGLLLIGALGGLAFLRRRKTAVA